MTMKLVFISVFLTMLHAASSKESEAFKILDYDDKSGSFHANDNGLEKLKKLDAPLYVVSALGDARIGKSSTFNRVIQNWDCASKHPMVEHFKTGHTAAPETQGIWGYVLPACARVGGDSIDQSRPDGHVLLLDTEGIDLGDTEAIRNLGVLSWLLSSELIVFMKETLTAHVQNYMYEVVRVVENMFPDHASEDGNFPALHMMIRDEKEAPEGMSLEEYVRSSLTEDPITGELMKKYYGVDAIKVSMMPLQKSDFQDTVYVNSMKDLTLHIEKKILKKRSIHGTLVNGQLLADLVSQAAKAFTNQKWSLLANEYFNFELTICHKTWKRHVQPFLEIQSFDESLEKEGELILSNFKDNCNMKTEYLLAEEEIAKIVKLLKAKDEKEKEEQRQKEEEERKEREERERLEAEEEKKRLEEKAKADEAARLKAEKEAAIAAQRLRCIQALEHARKQYAAMGMPVGEMRFQRGPCKDLGF